MDHHKQAWEEVRQELVGTVCEVAMKRPWGFCHDRADIKNVTCTEFFKDEGTYGTVLLHILLGEGCDVERFSEVLRKACRSAFKVVILEHSPESPDWVKNSHVSAARIDRLESLVTQTGERYHVKDWGRNRLYAFTTVAPLFLDQVNDAYVKKALAHAWEKAGNPWIKHGYYTHSSETVLPAAVIRDIPAGRDMYWIIGGLMFLSGVPRLPHVRHRLIDTILRQVIYARLAIEEDDVSLVQNKLGQLCDLTQMMKDLEGCPLTLGKYCWWQNFLKLHGVDGIKSRIHSMEHMDIKDLHVEGQVVYTSTAPRAAYDHLCDKNWIVAALEPVRDVPGLTSPKHKR